MKEPDNCEKWRKRFWQVTGKRGLDNCGEKAKKTRLAQQTGVIAAAGVGAAADEGELLRQGENGSKK